MLKPARITPKSILLMAVLSTAGGLASAQEVPAEVIEQCQSTVDASDLPECLTSGAVAVILMERAVLADYFGPDAALIIDICREQNDDFASSWTCFSIAAEKAAETARLIGRDAISDSCVRTIADADVIEKLKAERAEVRSLFDPSSRFYGGGSYFPFKGCPEPVATDSVAPDVKAAPQGAASYDTEECQAFGAVDEFLGARTSTELRAIFPLLEALPEEEWLISLSKFGLPATAVDVIATRLEQQENQALGVAMLMTGMLGRHHPDLVQEILEIGDADETFADQFASGFLSMLTDSALESYEDACSK